MQFKNLHVNETQPEYIEQKSWAVFQEMEIDIATMSYFRSPKSNVYQIWLINQLHDIIYRNCLKS